jgi:hypothetical protein
MASILEYDIKNPELLKKLYKRADFKSCLLFHLRIHLCLEILLNVLADF